MGDLDDDRELWQASLSGDGAAFAQLWDRHRDRAFRSALRVVDTAHDAEDVVAGAFLELWRRRSSIRLVDGSILPWLLVAVFNIGRNVRRGLNRHRVFLASLPSAEHSSDHSDGVLDRVNELRDERSMVAVLRRLPPSDQKILLLVAIEGLSLQEAGAALGIRADAAKTRLARARRRARHDFAALPAPTEGTTS